MYELRKQLEITYPVYHQRVHSGRPFKLYVRVA